MGVTVAWLMANMTALELSYHAALYSLEPWGPPADDIRLGTVAASFGGGNPSQMWPWSGGVKASGGWKDLKSAMAGYGKRDSRSKSEGQ